MQSLAKAQATMRDLKERLEKRVSGSATIDTVRASQDSSGNPMLFLSDAGNEAAGQPVIAIRIQSQDAVSKDVFGNDLKAFGPHTLEVAYELTAGGKQTPNQRDLIKAQLEVSKLGHKIEVKEIANATAVTATSMNATSPADSLEYDTQWPAKGI